MTKIRKHSKKHRGIRDPFKQLDAKNKLIKDKINNPPKNPTEQEICKVSKSFQNDIKVKLGRTRTKKLISKGNLVDTSRFVSTNIGEYPKNGREFKPIPTLIQCPNEENYKFFRRVHKATEVVKHEAQFQDKHKVEVKRDDSGQVTGFSKRQEFQSNKKLEEAIARKEKKKLRNKEQSLRKKYKKMKKCRRLNRNESSDEEGSEESIPSHANIFRKELVKYGDIVHAPPKLETAAIEKKVKEEKNLQIKNFLFLQSLKTQSSGRKEEESFKLKKNIIEIEREKAIFAYKQLKASRNSSLRLH